MTRRPPALLRTIGLLLCFALASCNGSAPSGPPLRIGINPWPGYEFLHLADVKGFFRDAGVEVRLVEFSSLSDARRSYERGQLDGLACTVAELVQSAQESNRWPRVVLVPDYSAGGDEILARSGIDTLADLRGRTVGVELGSLGIYLLARALESANLSIEDVKIVPTNQLTMQQELIDGELDAVVTYPPTSIGLLQSGQFRSLFSSAQIPGEVLDVLAVDQSILESRPRDVARMVAAFFRAVDYAEENPDEAYAIMGHREGLTAEQFKGALTNGIVQVSRDDQAEYLRSGGRLNALLPRVEAVMRATKQINRPHRDLDLIAGALPPP